MEPESEHTGMRSLLEHDAANTSFPLGCALEHGRTELRDERIRMREAAVLPGGQAENVVLVCRSNGIVRKRRMRVVPVRVSPESFRPVFGHCFGAYATPGGKLVLLLLRLSENLSGKTPHSTRTKRFSEPSANAELRPWESRPLARLRPV